MATIYYSDLATDAMADSVISAEFLRLWAGPNALPQHPAFAYAGPADPGSKVKRVPIIGTNGYNLMAPVAEGTAATGTALTTSHSDVTVARYVLAREVGDLARMADATGAVSHEALGQDAFASYSRTLLSLICNVGDGFTNSVTCAAGATLDEFLQAVALLEAENAPAGFIAVLAPKQWAQIRQDITTSAGGSIPFDPATPELVAVKGGGYQGRLLGIDIFVTDDVVDNSSLRKGFIASTGAFAYADMVPPVDGTAGQLLIGGKVLWESDRQALKGKSDWVGSAYMGVSMGINERGVTFSSAS